MESIVLSEFRERYPNGSLIGELMAIQDGNYVVRAIVEVEGKAIATGLAAASTVEEAEDRARMRALDVLGRSPFSVDSTSMLTPQDPNASLDGDPVSPAVPSVNASPPPATPSWEGEFQPETLNSSQGSQGTFSNIQESIEPTTPTDNLERLMNKTTVEIQRLGWSAAQGRRYLEQTYEKRSRQHLTREELVEFLAYLESQPTPEDSTSQV